MIFYSRVSQMLVLCLLTAYLSLPLTYSLASESVESHQDLTSNFIWTRSHDEKDVDIHHKTTTTTTTTTTHDLKKNYNKKETRKIKSIHHHNVRHYKKEEIKKNKNISKVCPHTHKWQQNKKQNLKDKNKIILYHSKSGKVKSDKSNDLKESLISKQQGLSSLIHVTSPCGKAQPTSSTTVSSGPNGNESFLNCGITGDGWTPPDVGMSMLKSLSLDQEPAKTTFSPCSKYRSLFEKHGKSYDIPPIFLAAFAMQESSCRPDVLGDNGGAFGLMQITKDKCGGAPNGNCADPDYNIKMGAKTFADGLKETNGNVLKALGGYNGWTTGLTKNKALEAKSHGCCVCQQNLDYLHQFLNGWILGIDPHSHRLGTMRNLDACGDQS